MAYQTRDILTPITSFIKTCPFLEEFNIKLGNMGVQQFNEPAPPQSMVEYVGSQTIETNRDVLGSAVVTRQADFIIYLLRKSNDPVYRAQATLFCDNFEQWVDYCQFYDLTPKLGNCDLENEIMCADNAMYFSEYETEQGSKVASQYQIQLHVLYKTEYERGI